MNKPDLKSMTINERRAFFAFSKPGYKLFETVDESSPTPALKSFFAPTLSGLVVTMNESWKYTTRDDALKVAKEYQERCREELRTGDEKVKP
jgi:hypothetical protein